MPDLPILRGSFTDGLTTSRVNWQGFYVGGQGGYGIVRHELRRLDANMLATLLATTSSGRCRFDGISMAVAGQGSHAQSALRRLRRI